MWLYLVFIEESICLRILVVNFNCFVEEGIFWLRINLFKRYLMLVNLFFKIIYLLMNWKYNSNNRFIEINLIEDYNINNIIFIKFIEIILF